MEVGLQEVADVERHIELRAYLCTRTLRCGEKLMKLPSTAAFEALSDIRHNRYGSSLDLPCKSKIFGKRPLLANLMDCPRESSGFLPGN